MALQMVWELVKGDADLLLERERSLPNAGKGIGQAGI